MYIDLSYLCEVAGVAIPFAVIGAVVGGWANRSGDKADGRAEGIRQARLIAVAEFAHWHDSDPEEADQMMVSLGATAAAANIVASLTLGRTAEEHAASLKRPAPPAKE